MTPTGRLARLLGRSRTASAARCGLCRAFNNDPRIIEAAVPGLRSLGSAVSSVRDADGLCQRHDRYIRASACCADFEPVAAA